MRCKADFIVMGSHGHGALYNLLIGGTASGVIQKAPCPVVIVPTHKTEKNPLGSLVETS
jgi:nucleotide-binding universal stress UspA family protein